MKTFKTHLTNSYITTILLAAPVLSMALHAEAQDARPTAKQLQKGVPHSPIVLGSSLVGKAPEGQLVGGKTWNGTITSIDLYNNSIRTKEEFTVPDMPIGEAFLSMATKIIKREDKVPASDLKLGDSVRLPILEISKFGPSPHYLGFFVVTSLKPLTLELEPGFFTPFTPQYGLKSLNIPFFFPAKKDAAAKEIGTIEVLIPNSIDGFTITLDKPEEINFSRYTPLSIKDLKIGDYINISCDIHPNGRHEVSDISIVYPQPKEAKAQK